MDEDVGRKYRVNSDFVVPEPTPADFFASLDDPGQGDRQRVIRETFGQWERGGFAKGRVTLTGPEVEGDESGYPAGLWLEGWRDPAATMLAFGASWPTADSAIWPPLTSVKP